MFYKMIEAKRNEWLASNDCTVKGDIAYIERTGQMRDAQIEAIKTYLFLKFESISSLTQRQRHYSSMPALKMMPESKFLQNWNGRSAKNRKALIAMRSSTKPFMDYRTPTTCSASPWAQARPI